MTVRIKKLTPPQVAALRESLPACVEAGVLTTTGSIAAFNDGAVETFGHIDRDKVLRLLTRKAADAEKWMTTKHRKPLLLKVLDKLEHRPDLVEES